MLCFSRAALLTSIVWGLALNALLHGLQYRIQAVGREVAEGTQNERIMEALLVAQ